VGLQDAINASLRQYNQNSIGHDIIAPEALLEKAKISGSRNGARHADVQQPMSPLAKQSPCRR
jgi:hypothetical protein